MQSAQTLEAPLIWIESFKKPARNENTELRDPTDNPFLSTAVFAEVQYLISRDKDLLILKKFRNVEIASPKHS